MTTQHITVNSPACIGALLLIGDFPGITTGEIAKRGGWSVFHIRNCLRYLRGQGKIKSARPMSNGECQWWIGVHDAHPRAVKAKPIPVTRGVSSVFALGAQ